MYFCFRLKHKGVFQLIHKHNLYPVIHDMIEGLMELDSEQAIAMLLEKERVPSDVVVSHLKNNKRFLYLVSLYKLILIFNCSKEKFVYNACVVEYTGAVLVCL